MSRKRERRAALRGRERPICSADCVEGALKVGGEAGSRNLGKDTFVTFGQLDMAYMQMAQIWDREFEAQFS